MNEEGGVWKVEEDEAMGPIKVRRLINAAREALNLRHKSWSDDSVYRLEVIQELERAVVEMDVSAIWYR